MVVCEGIWSDKMKRKTIDNIIKFIWAILLFTSWVIISVMAGMEGEWWSLFRINPEEYGMWAIEFSYLNIVIIAVLSIIGGGTIFRIFEKRI
ncbi:hypothetical protein SAMN04487944_115137 [Gracilibacillus ureilyticus]|uniref:Uncharacterized protein n=2 Tax=Gracilibacillus ureilyticus TaxID=531814 RepID=A0A1H9U263_9BACI|nr:hypothetical protein SAMN04487944_115137 [Gracilibacillus ureilyticus]